jgi:septum formation protein
VSPASDESQPVTLVLASTSRYRRELLERLRLPFATAPPRVVEDSLAGEKPEDLALRLARLKAEAVAAAHPGAVVIGSDQVAELDGEYLAKPLTVERCIQQLQQSSGRSVRFLTAVHLIDGRGQGSPHVEAHLDNTAVQFRRLGLPEIRRYVEVDLPLDCAGGFKAESLGITLFEEIRSHDPTALMGLPLIWLSGALRRAGFAVP